MNEEDLEVRDRGRAPDLQGPRRGPDVQVRRRDGAPLLLANKVELNARPRRWLDLLRDRVGDAWVWDMYRPARFLQNVRVMTFATSTSNSSSQGSVSRRPHRASGALGATGELLAADFFTRRSATIVGRNRRVSRSELDLLVRMGNVTVVVEVKTVSRTGRSISAAALTGPSSSGSRQWQAGDRAHY